MQTPNTPTTERLILLCKSANDLCDRIADAPDLVQLDAPDALVLLDLHRATATIIENDRAFTPEYSLSDSLLQIAADRVQHLRSARRENTP